MVGTSASPMALAAIRRPWPAIMRPSGSAKIGFTKAELTDGSDDLIYLLLGMRARVARIRSKRLYRAVRDRKRRRRHPIRGISHVGISRRSEQVHSNGIGAGTCHTCRCKPDLSDGRRREERTRQATIWVGQPSRGGLYRDIACFGATTFPVPLNWQPPLRRCSPCSAVMQALFCQKTGADVRA